MSTILIDNRAGSVDLVGYEPLASTAELCSNLSTDVVICGNGPSGSSLLVGVEVKSITDLISSISTGRLQDTQLPKLLADHDVTWLLTYGSYGADNAGRLSVGRGERRRAHRMGSRAVPYGYVEAMLLTLAAEGVHHKHCADMQEAAQWLGVLHRWWSKEWHEHKGLHVFDRSQDLSLMPHMDDHTKQLAEIASRLPGVGYQRAVAAANYFDSAIALVCADKTEWARVPGIGKVIAGAIVDAVRRVRKT